MPRIQVSARTFRALSAVLVGVGAVPLYAAPDQPEPVTAQIIVTAQYYSSDVNVSPTLADVAISMPSGAQPVSLRPFDSNDPVQVYLVIDNCSDFDPGAAADELRRFLRYQLPATTIGSAYIRDGHIDIVRSPTADRNLVIDSLTAPAGCKPTSPFSAVSELIQGWQQNNSRHIVIMISNGIDPEIKAGYNSDSAEATLAVAQRAGVVIYAIYHPARQYATSSFGAINSGQVLLSHVACESGGQGYFLGAGPMQSVAPFLSDIAAQLEHQYKLEFIITPDAPGGLQSVSIRSTNHAFALAAPTRVWIASHSIRP
jgi:hypothetical protein